MALRIVFAGTPEFARVALAALQAMRALGEKPGLVTSRGMRRERV